MSRGKSKVGIGMRKSGALVAVLGSLLLSACGSSSVELSGDAPDRVGTSAMLTSSAGEPAGSRPVTSTKAVADTLTSVSNPTSTAYKVGPLDVLEITVFKVPELSKTAQVSERGTFNYPLVGEVEATGRTPREIEQILARSLGAKYLQSPQVGVFVKEYNSKRITLEGQVKKPGVYPMQGGITLLQAIATAGGMDTIADDTVLILRTENGKRSAARFDVSELRDGKTQDPPLKPGDVIVAGKSSMKEGWNNFIKLLPLASVFALL